MARSNEIQDGSPHCCWFVVLTKLKNTKIVQSLQVKQKLELASAETIEVCSSDIQGVRSHVDIWQVEKRVDQHTSKHRAEAYGALIAQYRPNSLPVGTGGEDKSTVKPKIEEAEEEYHRAMEELVSAIMTEGVKVPGGHGITLASSLLSLVPQL